MKISIEVIAMRMNCGYLTSSETAKLPLKEIGTSSE
jgi:hypothetical protein